MQLSHSRTPRRRAPLRTSRVVSVATTAVLLLGAAACDDGSEATEVEQMDEGTEEMDGEGTEEMGGEDMEEMDGDDPEEMDDEHLEDTDGDDMEKTDGEDMEDDG
jgi:hypothetical protein